MAVYGEKLFWVRVHHMTSVLSNGCAVPQSLALNRNNEMSFISVILGWCQPDILKPQQIKQRLHAWIDTTKGTASGNYVFVI